MNHGVNLDLSALDICRCSTSGATQRQSAISSELILGGASERTMNTEQSSCSAPVASNCAWYWNLNKNLRSHPTPSSSDSRLLVAASMLSARRGWLQQLLDQYSGQRRFLGERCCRSRSPRPLKISREKARCRTPRPSWHRDLLKWPSRRSFASTKSSASGSSIISLSSIRCAGLASSISIASTNRRRRRRSSTDDSVLRNDRASLRRISRPGRGARRNRLLGAAQ